MKEIIPVLILTLATAPAATVPAAAQHGHDHGAQHGEHQEGHGEMRHHTADHDFSDAERWSAMFDNPERDAWQKPDEVVRAMAVGSGMTVADLGAGTGYFLGRLADAVGPEGHVLGLDPEPGMVRFMTERAEKEGWTNVEAREIPYDNPGLDDGSTDRILVVNTWHHIQDREAYAGKLRAALKDGGAVFVVDLTKDSPHGPPPEARLEPEQIAAELRGGGFSSVEVIEETLPHQFIVRAGK